MVQKEGQHEPSEEQGQATRRIVIRASSVPRVIACHQSAHGEVRIDDDRPEGRLGTAVHVVADHYIRNRVLPDLTTIASLHRVPCNDEFEFLCRSVVQAWEQGLAKQFPGPLVEQSMAVPIHQDGEVSVHLTGHPDMVSLIGPAGVRICDWKSGRRKDDFRLQLLSYAVLAAKFYHADTVSGTVVWLRDRTTETFKFSREQLDWLTSTLVAVALTPSDYRVGEYCVTCPRFAECPARRQLCVSTQQTILSESDTVAVGLDADRLHKLRTGIKCLKAACEKCEEQIKAEVRHHGSLPLPDGKSLVFRSKTRRRINSAAAWPILREYLPAHVATGVTTIGITALKRAVMDSQLTGQKAKAWQDVMSRLEQVGAVITDDTPYLTETDEQQ